MTCPECRSDEVEIQSGDGYDGALCLNCRHYGAVAEFTPPPTPEAIPRP
jgi:hypothetical protein